MDCNVTFLDNDVNKYFKTTISSDSVHSMVLCHLCQEENYPFTYQTAGLHGCKLKESTEEYPPKVWRQNDNLDISNKAKPKADCTEAERQLVAFPVQIRICGMPSHINSVRDLSLVQEITGAVLCLILLL